MAMSVLERCNQFGGSIRKKRPATGKTTSQLLRGQKFTLDEFNIGRLLGAGGFGKVYFAQKKGGSHYCAIKFIPMQTLQSTNGDTMLRREIGIHSNLRHPHVVHMYTDFKDDLYHYLVLEYMPGNDLLHELLQRPDFRFQSPEASRYVRQVAEALIYCHDSMIIHRDVKPQNVLLAASGDAKLADFGLSIVVPKIKSSVRLGTLQYMAPEILKKQQYDNRVDVWALGVMTFVLLAGELPYNSIEDCPMDLYKQMKKQDLKMPCHFYTSDTVFVENLLQFHPDDRSELRDALKTRWIVRNKEIDDRNRLQLA